MGPVTTGKVNVSVEVLPPESITVTVIPTEPDDGGVPVSSPVELSDSQVGCWLAAQV
jgi:hypothetical protein